MTKHCNYGVKKSINLKDENKNEHAQDKHIQKLKKSSNEIENSEKTLNQVRKDHGLQPIKEGNQYYHKVMQ